MINSRDTIKKILFCLLLSLSSTNFAATHQPLAVDQAFQLQAHLQHRSLILHWQIAPTYQLYKKSITVKPFKKSGIQLAAIKLPNGIAKVDAILGHHQVYLQTLTVNLLIIHYQNGEFRVLVTYQGCSDEGFCYPPQQRLLTLQISPFGAQVQSIETVQTPTPTPALTSALPHKNLPLLLLSFFAFGILLAFTPCVLPMIPILSGIIVGQKRNTQQAFWLSLTYVLAMAIAYAVAGMLAGLLGKNLQAALQTPLVIILFAILFIALALSLFGLYELRLPNRWHHHLTQLSQRQQSGSYIGAAIMGALSILIVSPCISAPLVAALAYISQTGHATLGGLILFIMGLGMGTPLLIIGTLEGKFLPKAGRWMNTVKIIFGVLLLITAVWLLYRLLPGYIGLILWSLIAIVSALYLGALRFARINVRNIVWYLLLWLWLALGVVFLIGGILKNQDPLHPLTSRAQSQLNFININNLTDLQQALNKAHGKTVMLDFYADWCVSCRLMEQNIFQQQDVQALLKNIVLLRANVTANTAAQQALQQHLHVFAPPTIIFFNANGQEINNSRIVGEISKQAFIKQLKQLQTSA